MTHKPATTSTPSEGTVQGGCTLLADARETLAEIDARRVGVTHYEGCRRDHTGCLIAQLICEVERLREAIRRLLARTGQETGRVPCSRNWNA